MSATYNLFVRWKAQKGLKAFTSGKPYGFGQRTPVNEQETLAH